MISDSPKEPSAEKPLKMIVCAGLDLQLELWDRIEKQVCVNITMGLGDLKDHHH